MPISTQQHAWEPVAIIGMACRMPGGVHTPEAFWSLLSGGLTGIREVAQTSRQWAWPDGADVPDYAAMLEGVEQFDAPFFHIPPKEAVALDPQQRMLLETSWEALEQAGINPVSLRGSDTGVFVGISSNDYQLLQVRQNDTPNLYESTGTSAATASGRLSHFLGLRGPAISVDTAGSSSLVAFHLACQSLQSGECQMAVASGVNLILAPALTVAFSGAGMLSPDGRSTGFDAGANGYVRGEGCGVVVLKRLSAAQRDGDHILAIVRGSAVNQDGASQGLTVPNGSSQEALIRKALEVAGVKPDEVSYVEAHGSGSPSGDVIEGSAVQAVYGQERRSPWWMGSVKSNIGHLEAAAGIAGVIKTVLALQHRYIPSHPGFTQLNPELTKLDGLQTVIPVKGQDWNVEDGEPRRAGVSSFGLSGTNAHVILEEARQEERLVPAPTQNQSTYQLVPLSARHEQSLRSLAKSYVTFLTGHPEVSLAEVSHTLKTGRADFECRLAAVADSVVSLQAQLQAFLGEEPAPGLVTGIAAGRQKPKVAFLFTGFGSQYVGMGRELFTDYPVFREAVTACDEILRPWLETPLLKVLYPSPGESSPIDEMRYMPALFAIEYALAKLWQSWGIEPDVLLGHSFGEYVAACIAGVFSLEDGLKLSLTRGRLMEATAPGEMVALAADEAEVSAVVSRYADEAAVGVVNGAQNTVISGSARAIEAILAHLPHVKATRLNVSCASHSPLMDSIMDEFVAAASRVTFAPPQIPLVSNNLAAIADERITSPDYWRRHLRDTVRFGAGIEVLYQQGVRVFVEIGPKPVLLGVGSNQLSALARNPASSIDAASLAGVNWLPSLRPNVSDRRTMLEGLAALYTRGFSVAKSEVEREDRRRLMLPTYPFQRQRYWYAATAPQAVATTPRSSRPPHTGLPQPNVEALIDQGDAEAALMKAAGMGLFPSQQPHPSLHEAGDALAFATNYVARPYRVRYARIEDLDAVDVLEELCWDAATRASRAELEARLRDHPQDHLVLVFEDEVAGVIYSQRLAEVGVLDGISIVEVSERRCDNGPVVQLLAVNINPVHQMRQWGDELLEFMLQRCALLRGVHAIVGVTRCKNFHQQELPMEAYIQARNRDGWLVDPILRFHELHGAHIVRLMPGYRPTDQLNQGYGVLIHYDPATRQRREVVSRSADLKVSPAAQSNPAPRLEYLVKSLLPDGTAFAWNRPLMEMGLDSADLLLLSERVTSSFGFSAEPVFFFTHNTCEKILSALTASSEGKDVKMEQEKGAGEGIAIVGMACRLPGGVTTPESLWRVLAEGRDVVETIPADRWEWPDGVGPKTGYPGIDCGGFLDDIARFDAGLFRISPREAKLMDPQQRILLELAWSALEDAGYSKDAVAGTKTGVFVGASGSDYRLRLEQDRVDVDAVMGTGTAVSVLPNRISYFFDLQGPSLLIDTACSSSLVAVHEAMQALRAGSCQQALVGGINIICHPAATIAYYKAGMLSPEGRCQTFAAEANGYVRAEGAVVMMLKPLSAARRDGDRIYAVLKGSACNHGGQAGGLTVPNPQQQTVLLRDAWRAAGVEPNQLGYLEAHGTGTALGDPIEVTGMRDAFRAEDPTGDTTCYLGSIKSNLGHLEAAAGIAGLMKLALCLQHRQMVPTLHVDQVNPKIGLEETRFRIAQKITAWPLLKGGQLSMAGVSSFGSGGTNAHVVVEGVEPAAPSRREGPVVIRLSASNAERLATYARQLSDHLQSLPEGTRPSLSAIAYSLSRRQPMGVSASYRAEDEASLFAGLDAIANGLVTKVSQGEELCGEGPVVSLPGYPFAKTSFWFEKPASQPLPAQQVKVTFDAAGQSLPAISGKVTLEDPVQVARRGFGTVGIPALLPGTSPTGNAAEKPCLELTDQGDGLWIVRATRRDVKAEQLLAELQAGVASLENDPTAKVLLLADLGSVSDDASSPAVREEALDGLVKLCCGSPLVLIVAIQPVKESPSQIAKRLIAVADLRVCAEEAAGPWLQDRVGPVRTVPVDEVMSVALALGRQIASKPRLSLSLLKAQLGRQAATGLGLEMSWTTHLPSFAEDGGKPLARRRISLHTDVVTVEVDNEGIVWVTLCDRASKNSFSEAFLDGVCEAFDHIRGQSGYKVVVLTGFGRYFCSGGTKEGLLSIQQGRTKFTDLKVFSLPLECELPVIAAMQGHAIGAGWSFGLFCDLPILAKECVYEAPYMRYGFTPGAGSTLVFPARMGFDLAAEILLAGQTYTGADLRARGLAWPVLPAADVEAYAGQVARQWARRSRTVLMEEKAVRCAPLRVRLAETLAQELAMHGATFVGQDGVAAAIHASFNEPIVPEETKISAPVDTAPPEDVSSTLYRILRETLAHELQMEVEDVENDRPFLDMGLDSVIGVTWARKLNEMFGLSIAVPKIYAHPTVRAMGNFLLQMESVRQTLADAAEPTPATLDAPIEEIQNSDDHLKGEEVATAGEEVAIDATEGSPAIAIIGMSGQFPKANNVNEFWQNLLAGRDCISEVPSDRWPVDAYFDPTPQVPGKTYGRWMGVLEDADKFDPLFFSISPHEAAAMDPQQRLFLEACWGCIEDAGYAPSRLSGTRCGVFAGCGTSDYNQHLGADSLDAQRFMGGSLSILAARISYELNLRGPSLAIDTACSASLVAIAVACDNLAAGACDTALAGGVCVMAGPAMHIMTSQARMLSPEGRCFTFDQRANGFVPGEGVGVILLKRLADAERDGDQILGVLRGWGVNQDGKTNGITAPNGDSQASLQRSIYERHGIDPATIQLVEAHGTGTKLGDPIEVEGLCQAFTALTDQRGYCALGSAKSNIGHLLMAAGVAGVIKTLLALKHRTLPPTIHYEQLNEHIALEGSPFYVNDRARHWRSLGSTPRRAAVSSFGFSGTNAHVVVEEYVPEARQIRPQPNGPFLVVLSAKKKDRLRQAAQRLYDHLVAHPEELLADMAYTLQVGRDAMAERVGFLATSRDELAQQLTAFLEGRSSGQGLWVQGTAGKGTRVVFDSPRGDEATLRAWVGGAEIDWSKLSTGEPRPARLSLPTYPFARERYWACSPLPGGVELVPRTLASSSPKSERRAPMSGSDQVENDWLLQPLSTEVDWRGRFLISTRGSLIVLHQNEADADALVDLLQQMSVAAGRQEAVNVQCFPIEDGEVVSFEQEPTTIFVLGEATPHLSTRRAQVYQLLERPVARPGSPTSSWVYVVCEEMGTGVAALQRLFQEWLADDSTNRETRHVRYVGQQRFIRPLSTPLTTSEQPWLIEKRWTASPPTRKGLHVQADDLIVLVNDESAALAQRLFPQLPPNNLWWVKQLGRDASACHATGMSLQTGTLIDLSDLYTAPREIDAHPLDKTAFYQGLIGQGAPLNLLHVTKGLQAFRASRMSLAGAKFAGLVKMLSAEYGHVQARCLDIDDHLYSAIDTLRAVLLGELESEFCETEICYRNGDRFVPQIEALLAQETSTPSVSCIADQGVYVVTGGTRGIGLEIANELVDLGARKLVLMGRQNLPPAEQWSDFLNAPDVDSALRDKLANLQALRQRVQALEIYTGALTDGNALRVFFDDVRASHGKLRGIVHAAGVYSDLHNPAFVQKNLGEMEQVWEPKVGGLEQLADLFVEDDLDFFISFSSLTGLIPSLARGSSDYAMANAFMDFMAAFQFHQKNRRAWRTVTWVDWREAGVTARSSRAEIERLEKNLAEVGLSTFDNQEGRALFRRVLQGPARPWVLLSHLNEEAFRRAQPTLLHGHKSVAGPSTGVTSPWAALDEQLAAWEALKQQGVPCSVEMLTSCLSLDEIRGLDEARIDRIYHLLANEPEDQGEIKGRKVEDCLPNDNLASVIRATLLGLLKLPSVDDDEAFQNYGLDSISAAIFSNRLERALGRPVQPQWLLEYPTVLALTRQLEMAPV